MLKQLGKVTGEELEKMIVDDLPCEWRLACQMIVRTKTSASSTNPFRH